MSKDSDTSPATQKERKVRDGWDKFELLAKPLSGIIAAVTIAIIGFIGQDTLTTIANQSESARLFTELQVRREESESALRKDVFNQTLKLLLDDSDTTVRNDPSKSLLRLELLALNFGDTLSLAPLFTEMDRDLSRLQPANDDEAEDWDIRVRNYKKRLRSLAKRVAGAQVSAVLQKGRAFQIDVPAGYDGKTVFDWPTDAVIHDLGKDSPLLEDQQFVDEMKLDKSRVEFADVTFTFTITLSDFDRDEKTVKVDLGIVQEARHKDGRITPVESINRKFTLNYYNFPMIDNTRLLTNKRFALVLEDFSSAGISIKGIVFPGQYSSHRDRPFLSDAIEDLKQQFREGTK